MLLAQSLWETNCVFPLYSCLHLKNYCFLSVTCSLLQVSRSVIRIRLSCCAAWPPLPVVAVTTWPTGTLLEGIHLQSSWWRKPMTFSHGVVIRLGKLNSSHLKKQPVSQSYQRLKLHTPCPSADIRAAVHFDSLLYRLCLQIIGHSFLGCGGARMLFWSRLGIWVRVSYAGNSRVGSCRKARLAELVQLLVLSHSFIASGRAAGSSWWYRCTEASWSCYAKTRTTLPAFRPKMANCHQQISHAFL